MRKQLHQGEGTQRHGKITTHITIVTINYKQNKYLQQIKKQNYIKKKPNKHNQKYNKRKTEICQEISKQWATSPGP